MGQELGYSHMKKEPKGLAWHWPPALSPSWPPAGHSLPPPGHGGTDVLVHPKKECPGMVKSSTFVTFVTSYKAVCHLCPFYKAHLSLPNWRGGLQVCIHPQKPHHHQGTAIFPKEHRFAPNQPQHFVTPFWGMLHPKAPWNDAQPQPLLPPSLGGSLGGSYRGGCSVLVATSSLGTASGRSSSARRAL